MPNFFKIYKLIDNSNKNTIGLFIEIDKTYSKIQMQNKDPEIEQSISEKGYREICPIRF